MAELKPMFRCWVGAAMGHFWGFLAGGHLHPDRPVTGVLTSGFRVRERISRLVAGAPGDSRSQSF